MVELSEHYAALERENARLRQRVAALEQQQQPYNAACRSTLDLLPVLLVAFDQEGRIVFWNQESARVSGYSADEIPADSQTLAWLFPNPDIRQRLIDACTERAAAEPPAAPLVSRLTTQDGVTRAIAWTSLPAPADYPEWWGWACGIDVTAWQEHEQRLQVFEAIIENAADYIGVTDMAGKLTYTNPSSRTMMGYGDAMIGMPYADIFDEDPDYLASLIAHTVVHGSWRGILTNRNADGTTFQGQLVAMAMYDTEGTPQAVAGIIRDVSELLVMEEALRQSQSLLYDILDHSPTGIFVTDRERRVLLLNKHLLDLFGLEREKVIGRRQDYVFPNELAKQWRGEDLQVLQTGQVMEFEETITSSEGKQTYLTIRFPMYDSLGSVYAVGGIATNITKRVRAEEAYYTLVQHSLQGLIVFQDFRIVFANPAAAAIVGYPIDELLALEPDAVRGLIHPDDQAFAWQRQHERLSGGDVPNSYEIRLVRKDGPVRWVALSAVLMLFQGRPATQVALMDITERKEAEGVLREAQERLEMRVQERTQELVQANNALQTEITERRRIEGWLRESEEKYRLLFSHEKDAISLVDIETGQFLDVNDAWQSVYGYTRQESLSLNALDVSAEPEKSWHTIVQSRDGEELRVPIRWHKTKDGAVFPVEIAIGTFTWNGRPVLCGIARDITERRRAEEELQRRDAILEAVGFAAEQFLRVSQLHQNIQELLQRLGRVARVCRVYVVEHDAGVYTPVMQQSCIWVASDTMPSTVPEALPHRWRALLEQGEPVQGNSKTFPEEEQAFLAETGMRSIALVPVFVSNRWWGYVGFDDLNADREWSSAKVDAIRVAAGIIGAAVERYQVQQALAKSESEVRKLYRAVEQSPISIVITDTNGIIEYVNPRFTRTTGYTLAEVVGKNPRILKSGELSKERYTALWQTILQGQEWRGEFHNRKKNGELYWESASITPITNAHGEITHFLAVKEDITEQKRNAEALQAAKDIAEAATRAKSEFLANMSHEIRTPMNAVIGMTTLLLDTRLSPEQRDCVETIRSSSDTLLAIINDILDFSKIEAGKFQLDMQPFDVYTWVEDSLDMVAAIAAEKHLNLAALIDADVPAMVVGDVMRLRQILINLLSNGVKFTPTGEVVVSVQVERKLHQGKPEQPARPESSEPAGQRPPFTHVLHVSVRDTGIGIASDAIDRLFQPFSQVDGSHTRKYGGTGLGLAISKRLVEMMHGAMWVESTVGQGSTFHMTFPTEAYQQEGVVPPTMCWRAHEALRGRRVLVVSGNATNRTILLRWLQWWGMAPFITVSDGDAKVALQQGETFDVAILDVHELPRAGIQLAAELRTFPQTEAMALVMMLPVGLWDDVVQLSNVRIDATVAIPIKPGMLYGILLRLFTGDTAALVQPKHKPQIDPNIALRQPLRILLVEDNVVNQKVAVRLLSRMGYQVDVAMHGREALTMLEHRLYDVILMDVQMPEMDGVEATRQIRELWLPHEQPWIIAMTAYALEGAQDWCLSSGMDDYVSKPVRVEELVRALLRVNTKRFQEALLASPDAASDEEQAVSGRGHVPLGAHCSLLNSQRLTLDLNVLSDFIDMLGGEIADRLIALYLEDTPRLLTNVRQALALGDVELFTLATHSIKSNSAQIGALRLSAFCKDLEEMGLGGLLDEASELLTYTETEYQRVSTLLVEEQGRRFAAP
jgi:PAS domain S-box-containing protein